VKLRKWQRWWEREEIVVPGGPNGDFAVCDQCCREVAPAITMDNGEGGGLRLCLDCARKVVDILSRVHWMKPAKGRY
jgi:hypothetical protein